MKLMRESVWDAMQLSFSLFSTITRGLVFLFFFCDLSITELYVRMITNDIIRSFDRLARNRDDVVVGLKLMKLKEDDNQNRDTLVMCLKWFSENLRWEDHRNFVFQLIWDSYDSNNFRPIFTGIQRYIRPWRKSVS